MSPNDLDDLAIESTTFDGEGLMLVLNTATLTSSEIKVASPRGFEPLLPP